MWEIVPFDGFAHQFKKFSRKHEDEASAAMSNLQTYVDLLNVTGNVLLANQESFVHSEPDGMVAIDQRGTKIERKRGKLKATRLYVYAALINTTVYLLGIGDKDAQRQDIETCRKKVRQINGELSHE